MEANGGEYTQPGSFFPSIILYKERQKEREGGKFGSAGGSPKRKIRGLENMTSEELLNGLGLASPKRILRKIWLTAFKLPSFCREAQNNIFSVVTGDET